MKFSTWGQEVNSQVELFSACYHIQRLRWWIIYLQDTWYGSLKNHILISSRFMFSSTVPVL